jgi:putative protein-disulfide isomerase
MNERNANKTIIWYFADPMCSWCWGFSPVADRLKEHYADRIRIALVLGGLRPYTREVISESSRREILHHWREVQRMTGQNFSFEGAMEGGFVYDTEPACRAVCVAGELFTDKTFEYFKVLQRAFYVEHKDITREPVLWESLRATVADSVSLDEAEFKRRFNSSDAKQKTQAHFRKSRQFGVRGFPTLILQEGERYYLLTSGYRAYEELKREIDGYLTNEYSTTQ